MQGSLPKIQQVRFRTWAVVSAIGVASALLLVTTAGMASADPSRPTSTNDVIGCCVCRGTAGGDATALRSCSDGASVDACVSQCAGQNADSIAFGYQQTCSQGCAGFPTQGLQ